MSKIIEITTLKQLFELSSMAGGSGVGRRLIGLKTARLWARAHRTHRTRFFAQKKIGVILSWSSNLKSIRCSTAACKYAAIVYPNIMTVVSTVIRSRSIHPTEVGPVVSTMRAVAAGSPHSKKTRRLAMPFVKDSGTKYELLPSVIRSRRSSTGCRLPT